ncbi:MAG: tyrosine-type recombinase/integrase [Lactobacillaceae bacterium]|jgi:integrase|nr:tyrosine-type recombinase/integrase [Lactobacillaceae bacterium]
MASIYKRSSNSTFSATVTYRENGVSKRRTKSGFKTKSDARAWAIIAEEQAQTVGLHTKSNKTLSQYIEFWTSTYRSDVSRSTKVWYQIVIKLTDEYFQLLSISDIQRADVQSFFNWIGANYSKSSARKIKNIMHQSIKGALYDDLIYKDPMLDIVLTGRESKDSSLKFLEIPQMKALVDEIQTMDITQRSTADMMILTAIMTGARYAEIAGLTWRDIGNNSININKSWDQATKSMKSTKTKNSVRIISVPDTLISDLYVWQPERQPSGFVFIESNQYPLTSVGLNKRLATLLNVIHSPKMITFHGLRHTHASWLISQGVDIHYVSERLGHSDIDTTLRVYTHLLDNKRTAENDKTMNLLKSV